MGCVGSNKQVRIDSVIFNVSRINIDSTIDATNIQQSLHLDQFNNSGYLAVKGEKTINSTMIDQAKLLLITDQKVNENYELIKPFLAESMSQRSPSRKKKKQEEPQLYLVKHIETRNTFIMKIQKKNKISPNNYFILHFDKIFRTISHPNIIEYEDFYTDETNYYIISEYTNGFNTTLKDEMTEFSEKQINDIIQQILFGLLHLHAMNIIYRNVCLENILVNNNREKMNIKLMNLDKSIEDENGVDSDSVVNVYEKMGSIMYYMSPEALKKNHTKKSDIWSAGILLYYLLYGFFPFEGDNIDEIYSKIKKGKFNLNDTNIKGEKISQPAKDLLSKMLLYSTKDRPSAYQCLHHPWFQNNIIPKERNGIVALTKCAVIIIIRYVYHKTEFNSVKSLYEELLNKKRKVYINDIYIYLSARFDNKQFDKNTLNKELTYNDFCKYLLNTNLVLTDSHISYAFEYIDKDKDNLLTLNDFQRIFKFIFFSEFKDEITEQLNRITMGYYFISLENKSMCFPEFKQHINNYKQYIEHL
jgi:serine/threonine protein kinase